MYELKSIGICKKCYYWDCEYYSSLGTVQIEPISLTIVPGASVEMDIHLLEEFTAVDKLDVPAVELLKIYPNPVVDNQFNYEINIPVRSTNCMLNLYNTKGQYLCSFSPGESKGYLT